MNISTAFLLLFEPVALLYIPLQYGGFSCLEATHIGVGVWPVYMITNDNKDEESFKVEGLPNAAAMCLPSALSCYFLAVSADNCIFLCILRIR